MRLRKRMISMLLVVSMLLALVPSDFAIISNAETENHENYEILINGQICGEDALKLTYKESIDIKLKDYSDSGTVTFYFSDNADPDQGTLEEIQGSNLTNALGTFYIGYIIQDSEYNDGDYFYDTHVVSVEKAAFAAPENLSWNESAPLKAEWSELKKASNGVALNEGAVSGYTVILYKVDGENKSEVQQVSVGANACSYDFTEIIGKDYGTYCFGVTAHVSESQAAYYTEGESAVSGNQTYADQTKPEINTFTYDSAKQEFTLKASDIDSGVNSYVVTPKLQDSLTEEDWVAVENSAIANGIYISINDTYRGGDYYAYVRDASGNVTQSEKIFLTKVVYHNDVPKDAAIFFHEDTYALKVPVREGYEFEGWFTDSSYSEESKVTNAVKGGEFSVYAKWKISGISFSSQPLDYTETYDGQGHTVSASLYNTVPGSGKVSWQWYKQDAEDPSKWNPVEGATSGTLTVKDVADSGIYRVKATITIGSDSTGMDSEPAEVKITKAVLTLTPASISVSYKALSEEAFGYDVSGFVGGDSKENVQITPGKIKVFSGESELSDLKKLDVGNYNLIASGYMADNYEFSYSTGSLTVTQKDVNAEGANVTAELALNEYTYETNEGAAVAHEPEVTVYDDGSVVDPSNYAVVYSNHANAGDAKVTITFRGNYKGVLEKTFSIKKASFTTTASMKTEYTYGDNLEEPNVASNPGSGKVTYYYEDAEHHLLSKKPVNAGTYYVYARIAATDNYEESVTEKLQFTIKKRKITLTAKGDGQTTGVWIYDGNPHSLNEYDQEGSFAGNDDFQNVVVSGTITDVGEVENKITYSLIHTVNPDNYDIQTVSGKLVITRAKLATPGSMGWLDGSNSTAMATWVPVVRSGLNIEYELQLYRVTGTDGNMTYTKAGEPVTTERSVYSFKEAICADAKQYYQSPENTAPVRYVYSVVVKAAGGSAQANYSDSKESAYKSMSALSTSYVKVSHSEGITSAGISRGQSEEKVDALIAIQGERFYLKAVCDTGYEEANPVWNLTGDSGWTIGNAGELTTQLTAPGSFASGRTHITAQAEDSAPVITEFTATGSGDHKTVTFSLQASDEKKIAGWMITTNGTAPDKNADGWSREGISEDGHTLAATLPVNQKGTYYAYVKDDAGNVVGGRINGASAYFGVYEITFAPGEQGSGEMSSLLKIQGQDMTLPENTFTRPGFTFKNWKNRDGKILANKSVYAADADAALTAIWTNEQYEYTVHYYYMTLQEQDGSYSAGYPARPFISKSFHGEYGKEITNTTEAIQNLWTGYSVDESRNDSVTLTENGKELNLYYKLNQYAVSYTYTDIDGATVLYGSEEYYFGQPIRKKAKPVKAGYDFVGWNFSGQGQMPETMPAYDMTATGSFSAQPASYTILYYLQNLNDENTYTLEETKTVTKNALQGDRITMSIGSEDIAAIEGFTPKYLVARTGESEAKNASKPEGEGLALRSATGTVSKVAGQELYFVCYYTRNTHKVQLNVWKGDRLHGGTNFFKKEWADIKYGTPFTSEMVTEYTTNNQTAEDWFNDAIDKGNDMTGYSLTSYIDWSTDTAPATMPDSDVVVSREFVIASEEAYFIEVYTENQDGSYNLESTLTYLGKNGQSVSLKDLGAQDSTETEINYTQFGKMIPALQYYQYKSEEGEKLTGKVSISDPLRLKIYFERKSYQMTVNYYDQTTTDKKLIHTETVSYKWGKTYADYLSEREDIPSKYVERFFDEKTISGSDGETYRNQKYVIYYTASYWNYIKGWSYPSRKMTKPEDLDNTYNDVEFGTAHNASLNVFYLKTDMEKTYELQVGYKANLAKGDKQFHVLQKTVGDQTYEIHIANKKDLYHVTASEWNNDRYPGAYVYKQEYTYGNLKNGYNTITIDGNEYVTKDNIIYIADNTNQFFVGNRAGLSYNNQVTHNLGYEQVEAYLTEYKNSHSDPSVTDQYDSQAQLAYRYNNSFYGVITENEEGQYKQLQNLEINFAYSTPVVVSLTHTINGKTCNGHSHIKDTEISDVACNDENVAAARAGYDIVWYKDANYATKAQPFQINGYTRLYGRYEKKVTMNDTYLVYELATPIQIDGQIIRYLTVEQAKDFVESGAASTATAVKTRTLEDAYGEDHVVTCEEVTYRMNGNIVLISRQQPSFSYSEIDMAQGGDDEVDDMSAFAPEGFRFDNKNTANKLKGYVENTPISLYAYYMRETYDLTVETNLTKLSNAETQTYNCGAVVNLPLLGTTDENTKTGYFFDGWKFYKETGEPLELSAVKNEDGSYSFTMPRENCFAEAVWKAGTYETTIYHYFQDDNLAYSEDWGETFSSKSPQYSGNVKFNDRSYSGTVYTDGSASITYGSACVAYFKASGQENATYCVEETDLLGIAESITCETETSKTVAAHQLSLDDLHMFAFAYATYQLESQTEIKAAEAAYIENPDMKLSYFYSRPALYALRTVAMAIDGKETGTVIIGDETERCYYGERRSLTANVSAGYQFVGWFDAKDVLVDYSGPSEQELSGYEFVSDFEEKYKKNEISARSTEAKYTVQVTDTVDLVAVVKPLAFDPMPTMQIDGDENVPYASEASMNVSVGLTESGIDSAIYVVGYQWYQNGAPIEGANSSTYNIPSDMNAGTYQYSCQVMLGRKDNGRTHTENLLKTVTIKKADMTGITVQNTEVSYDGSGHAISLKFPKGFNEENVTIYYAGEALTEANYQEKGQVTAPAYRDVQVDSDGNVTSYRTYVYIKDKTGNYNDLALNGTVKIKPVRLTLTASEKAFSKVYDGNDSVDGTITDTTSEKYEIASGNYYTVIGMVAEDIETVLLDFDAVFDTSHVRTATMVTLTNLKTVTKENGAAVYNYTFADSYSLRISGTITPFRLNATWDEQDSFVYNGQMQAPTATMAENQNAPDAGLQIKITGQQTNVGTYRAMPEIKVPDGAQYQSSDYIFNLEAKEYTITEKPMTVTPKNRIVTYNSHEQTLNDFDVTGLLDGHEMDRSIVETDQGGTTVGTYSGIRAANVHILAGGKNVTQNYAITYGEGALTIQPATIQVTGIQAVTKNYDGTTAAELNFAELQLHGILEDDVVTLDTQKVSGTFETAAKGTNKKVTLAFAEHALTGEDAGNYVIQGPVEITGEISDQTVRIKAEPISVVYGETIHYTVTCDGFNTGDSLKNAASGNLKYELYKIDSEGTIAETPTTGDHPSVGTYRIKVITDELTSDNYAFQWDDTTAGEQVLTVEKRPVRVVTKAGLSEDDKISKTYDNSVDATDLIKHLGNPENYYVFKEIDGNNASGVVSGETLDLRFANVNAVYDSKDVETAAKVTVTGFAIDNDNYELVTDTLELPGKITQKALAITAANKEITYGDPAPEYTFTAEGFADSEKTAEEAKVQVSSDYSQDSAATRKAGNHYKITPSYENSNYHITVTEGTLTVKKATVTIKPVAAKEMIFGIDITVPRFSPVYTGWKYDDTETVITAGKEALDVNAGYTCDVTDENAKTMLPGKYPITVNTDVLNGLRADNYQFEKTQGTLTIKRQEIVLSGIKVKGKAYDGTTSVKEEDIDVSDVKITYYVDGVIQNETSLSKDDVNRYFDITAKYQDAHVNWNQVENKADPVNVNLTITFKESGGWGKLYTFKSESQTSTGAVITQAPLTIKAKERTIQYGEQLTYDPNHPNEYVTYTGLVNGETYRNLKPVNGLTYTSNYKSTSGEYSSVGDYSLTIGGYEETMDYEITFDNSGVLHVQQATLETPVPKWSESIPGTVTWNAVQPIGDVGVDHYLVRLFKADDTTPLISTQVTEINENSFSCDFSRKIRENGPGKYLVEVQAVASLSNNGAYSNISQYSGTGKTKDLYATRVTVDFAADEISQAGKGAATPTVKGSASYVAIAGEKEIPIQAVLKNATGYTIKSCAGENGITVSDGSLLSGTYTAKIALASNITSYEDRKVTITLDARKAAGKVTMIIVNDKAPYLYSAENAPVYQTSFTVGSADNITAADYEFAYEWETRQSRVDPWVKVTDATASTYKLPTGMTVGSNKYYAQCTVTVTRKDNGQSIVLKANKAASIVRAAIGDSEVLLKNGDGIVAGWMYGDRRAAFAVSQNPENAPVDYTFSTEENGTYTSVVPKNAGTYYVKGYIHQSANYEAFTTAPKQFVITRNKLAKPANIQSGPSATAPYGKVTWNAVEGPKENAGTEGDSDSLVKVKYQLTLSRELAGEENEKITLEAPYTTNTWYDFTKYITKEGTYRATVTAMVANTSDEAQAKANCADSDPSEISFVISVGTVIQSDTGSFSKTYDGVQMVLSVSYSVNNETTYQWMLNGREIPGATASTYEVEYVEQSGVYTCVIYPNGTSTAPENIIYSNVQTVTVTPRPVVISSGSYEKIYDGAVLKGSDHTYSADEFNETDHKGLVSGDVVIASLNETITDQGSRENTITDIVIREGTGEDSRVLYRADGVNNNYTVTTAPGTLTVKPRSLNNGDAYTQGISVEDIADVLYRGSVYTPEVPVKDNGLAQGVTERTLVKGTDYTVSYSQNVNAGTADITITGKGNYTGSIIKKFTIQPLPVELQWDHSSFTYDGTEKTVTACVMNKARTEDEVIVKTYQENKATAVREDGYIAEATELEGASAGNYTLAGGINITHNWTIAYGTFPDATLLGQTKNSSGWYTGKVTVNPLEGYMISLSERDWKDSLEYPDDGEHVVNYYLTSKTDGTISSRKEITFKIDQTFPKGDILNETNSLKQSLNNLTFGLLFKNYVDVTITGEDTTSEIINSGIGSIEYQKVLKGDTFDAQNPWTQGTSLSITANEKSVIYAKITDIAGNATIINSDGLVVYQDATESDTISYTKTTKTDVSAVNIDLKGNTVKEVKVDGNTIGNSNYSVVEGRIVFKGNYLDTLSAGTHNIIVSYDPLGETAYISGEKPNESTITLNVLRHAGSVTITGTNDKIYDGTAAGIPAYTSLSTGTVTVEYLVDGVYITEAPKKVGTYKVRITVGEDENYAQAVSEDKEFTISRRELEITGLQATNRKYDGTVNIGITGGMLTDVLTRQPIASLISVDDVNVTMPTGGTVENKNAAEGKAVSVVKPELNGGDAANYTLKDLPNITVNIAPLPVILQWSTATEFTYKAADYTVTATVTNLVSGDDLTLTYRDNTKSAAGSYRAEVTSLDNANYTLAGGENLTCAWKINYLADKVAKVVGPTAEGDKENYSGWYNGAVSLVPPEGYVISRDAAAWCAALPYSEDGIYSEGYYLKETATGYITDRLTLSFKIDTTAPAGEIVAGTNRFTEFLNTITFGYFFKNTVAVQINGNDVQKNGAASGIKEISYQKVAEVADYNPNGTWITDNSFSMTANDKSVIYAKIVDHAGNVTIINSQGLVVYIDAVAVTSEITYVKTSGEDKTAFILSNGNKIKAITDDERTLTPGTDYTISGDGNAITFKGTYLQSKAAGEYDLNISYDPLGESYTGNGDGTPPNNTMVKLEVVKAQSSITDLSVTDKTYDTEPLASPTYRKTGNGQVTVAYKAKDADDSTYTTAVPVDAGEYTVRVSMADNEDYLPTSATADVTISGRPLKISGLRAVDRVYNGTTKVALQGGTLTDVLTEQPIASLFSADDVKVTMPTEGTVGDRNAATGKSVSVVKPILSGNQSANYLLEDIPEITVNIAPLPVILRWSTPTEFICKAQDYIVTAIVTNLVSGDNLTLTYQDHKKSAVGSYTAEVTELDNANYTLAGGENLTCDWKINYLADKVAKVTGPTAEGTKENYTGWYNGTAFLIPPEGYQISVDGIVWSDDIPITADGVHEIDYFLRNESGEIAHPDKIIVKCDSTEPNINEARTVMGEGDVTIFVDCVDAASGIRSCVLKEVPDGLQVDYLDPDPDSDDVHKIALKNLGTETSYRLTVLITDHAGWTTEREVSFQTANLDLEELTIDGQRMRLVLFRGVPDIPNKLVQAGMETENKIFETMFSNLKESYPVITEETAVLFDAQLQYTDNDGITWNLVHDEWYAQRGITVTLPYPEGTNPGDYDYFVSHMVTTVVGGYQPGDLERPSAAETENGLQCTFYTLSPIMVAWRLTDKSSGSSGSGSSTVQEQMSVREQIPVLWVFSPKTGDEESVWWWIGLMGLSGSVLTGAMIVKRKKKSRKKNDS